MQEHACTPPRYYGTFRMYFVLVPKVLVPHDPLLPTTPFFDNCKLLENLGAVSFSIQIGVVSYTMYFVVFVVYFICILLCIPSVSRIITWRMYSLFCYVFLLCIAVFVLYSCIGDDT